MNTTLSPASQALLADVAEALSDYERVLWRIGDSLIPLTTAGHSAEEIATRLRTSLHATRLRELKLVAELIPARDRNCLPWAHHREVARLPDDVRKKYLSDATTEGLTPVELRQRIGQRRGPTPRQRDNRIACMMSKAQEAKRFLRSANAAEKAALRSELQALLAML